MECRVEDPRCGRRRGIRPGLHVLAGVLLLLVGGSARGQARTDQSAFTGFHAPVLEVPDLSRQSPSQTFSPKRFWWGTAGALAADAVALAALSRLWYADYEQTRFHWHDDSDNWLQQDKLGHVVTALHVARGMGAYGRWSGLNPGRAALYGGGLSFLFLTQIEVLDGFSAGWGASWSDIAANALGAGWGALHVVDPGTRVATMKWSYRPSRFRDPDANLAANALKDYDGATFWLVLQPRAGKDAQRGSWPPWLGLAVGHSGDGLDRALPTELHPHRRVFVVAPDIDPFALLEPLGSGWGLVGRILSFLHMPAPALQLTPDLRFHLVYF